MSESNCVNIDRNNEHCTCPSADCERHGICCECISAHSNKDTLPACLKVKLKESKKFQHHLTGLVEKARMSE